MVLQSLSHSRTLNKKLGSLRAKWLRSGPNVYVNVVAASSLHHRSGIRSCLWTHTYPLMVLLYLFIRVSFGETNNQNKPKKR
jgi:hypothetical protein